MRVVFSIVVLSIAGCFEQKVEDSASEETGSIEAGSAYGSCSLDLVSASGYDYAASGSGESSVVVHLAYIDETYGVQEEDHLMEATDSGSWSLELDYVSSPEEVVLGQSTMWSVTGFGSGDRIFLGMTEDGEVCDCWDTDSFDVIVKDCSAFVQE